MITSETIFAIEFLSEFAAIFDATALIVSVNFDVNLDSIIFVTQSISEILFFA